MSSGFAARHRTTAATGLAALLALCAGCQVPTLVGKLAGAPPRADFFVAPDGNDEWSGRLPAPNRARSDGPFATVRRAVRAVRELRRPPEWQPRHVTVLLRGGVYRLDEPLVLTPEDSGSASAPVTYAAYPGEKPVLSGGKRVAGWRRHDERLWVADVPWAKAPARPFYQLFVNGARRPRARTPNEGSYFYSKRLKMAARQCTGLTFVAGDLEPWPGFEQTHVVLFHNWVNSYNRIGAVDWPTRQVRFTRPAGGYFLGPSVRYYIEGLLAALDQPGEWHLDRARGLLYHYPLPGEDMREAEVIAPALCQSLVLARGDWRLGLYVEHLVLRGLSFQHADADLSPDHGHSVQGAVHQKGAFFASGMRHVIIEDCEFIHLGEHAVTLHEGCVASVVRRCHIHDVGGGGVYLSEGSPRKPDDALLTAHNTVGNNFIHDGGHLFRAGCGVFLGGSASYNHIVHNEICDLSWMGVHLGWSWTGKAPAHTHHNEVAWNHIHHIGNGVLNDIGGIYTLGESPGTVLHHNLIHDVTRFERGSQGYGGWGIYLDAGSSEIRVEHNVVYNTRDGGLHLHNFGHPYGDLIANNVFAFSGDAELIRNANHEPDTNHAHLERNIVYSRGKRMLGGSNWRANSKFTADRNCYWSEAGEPDFQGKSFADWQATGRDRGSIVADPMFVDPARLDFRLRRGSPARALGFEPIDLTAAGLHGPKAWRRLPQTVVNRAYEAATAPPEPWPIRDDFEDYAVGEQPDGAVEDEKGARIAVTDREPASGRHCIRFDDAPGATAWKPHWCRLFGRREGRFRMQCSVRNDPAQPATFDLEFRDWTPPALLRTGPHLRFQPDGTVQVPGGPGQGAWVPVGRFPLGRWLRVEVEFDQGAGKPKTYALRITEPGGTSVVKAALPFRHAAFTRCSWVGFAGMDVKTATFYVDDITVE